MKTDKYHVRHFYMSSSKSLCCNSFVEKIKTMETIFSPTIAKHFVEKRATVSFFQTFMQWCEAQEANRLLWLAIGLAFHGCVLTPVAVLIIAMTGVNLTLLFFATLSMALVLISNLAALPTKYTIPTLILSIIMDAVVIGAAFAGA